MPFLSQRTSRDLAERIERAMRAEQTDIRTEALTGYARMGKEKGLFA